MYLNTQVTIRYVPQYNSIQFDAIRRETIVSLQVRTQVSCITSIVYRDLAVFASTFVELIPRDDGSSEEYSVMLT